MTADTADIEYATVHIDGHPVRVRTTPPPPLRAATLAPAPRRRPLPPEYTLTPTPVMAEAPTAPHWTRTIADQLPGFAAVVAAAFVAAGFVAVLIAG